MWIVEVLVEYALADGLAQGLDFVRKVGLNQHSRSQYLRCTGALFLNRTENTIMNFLPNLFPLSNTSLTVTSFQTVIPLHTKPKHTYITLLYMESALSPQSLPITPHLPHILALIQQQIATVISGTTGCGKSTQVPKALHLQEPKARIAVCQPRRVAATSLAVRVSQELGTKLGSTVGYHIGLQSFRSEHCSIVYMTYGILIQQLLFQPALPYTHIFLDQIHQRSLEMDFTFVALKQLANRLQTQQKATPKIIVMSATLDSQMFANYFSTQEQTNLFFLPVLIPTGKSQPTTRGNRGGELKQNYTLSEMPTSFKPAATYQIPESSQFKVDFSFLKESSEGQVGEEECRVTDGLAGEALKVLAGLSENQRAGDILFFLPGFFQIQMLKRKLIDAKYSEERIVEVHSMFSEELYEKLFESKIKNKLILATNIGESSITLPFCRVVIDFCLTKRQTLRQRGVTQLETRFASKASLTQRAGRVGRVADGSVFRMITKEQYETLPQYEEPQIKGITLQMVILRAKQLDILNRSEVFRDPYHFLAAVLDPPPVETVKNSIERLLEEQALVGKGPSVEEACSLEMTKIGEFMVSMPCDLQISKLIMMGIKFRIPGLVVAVASICMATKMFYAHEERRTNIEEFLHALIGYDQGLNNDFLLRERIYNHWKEQFYYPAKQKKIYQKKTKADSQQSLKTNPSARIYETKEGEEQDELFAFLQEFTLERWSEREKQFCFPRGLSLNTLREIVRIEQNLRLRIKGMGVEFKEKEKKPTSMFLLCLAYAFPHNDCEVSFGKHILRNKLDLNFIEIPGDWNIRSKEIQEYIYPQKNYHIDCSNKNYTRVEGSPSVLKKFIFPQYFHKNSINKSVSELFERLAKSKIGNKFEVEVTHGYANVVILNESVNRILIPDHYQGKFRILTNQLSMTGNRKMAKMTALIPEETHLMMKLIIDKEAEVSLHPSQEMLSSFKLAGKIHHFTRVIAGKELEAVKRLRSGALRKNTNDIHSDDEIMTEEDIDILAHFIENQEKVQKNVEPWQQTFIALTYGEDRTEKFYPLTHPFQFKPEITYFERYQRWKEDQYYSFISNYRQLVLSQPYIICRHCKHLEPIERLSSYSPAKRTLHLNQYSGSWETDQERLICTHGHVVGKIIEKEEQALLVVSNLKIYIPIGHVEYFWTDWPSAELLDEMRERGNREVMRAREELQEFECPFCLDKTEENKPLVLRRGESQQSFWKQLQSHFSSGQHIEAMSQLKKSLARK